MSYIAPQGWALMAVLAVMVLAEGCLQPAHAGEAYRWITEDGVLSFADDIEGVPARYLEQAKLVELAKLGTYQRLTISAPARPNARLAQLRREQVAALDFARKRRAVEVAREQALAYPITATREMRWLENHLGYSGKRYVAVDVLRDAKGRELSSGVSEIGLPRLP